MNTYKGVISGINSQDSFRQIDLDVNGVTVKVITLELDGRFRVKTMVRLLFKESEVVIAKNRTGMLSIENRYPGVITAIAAGEVFSEIIMDSPLGPITALIGRSAQDSMKLEIGDRVQAFIRSNEIAIMEDK